jgi:protein-S-isoprenylcysteine O-methyltransferase Ste14
MPRTALVGYTLFLALAFGLRALIHYRRNGTTGFVGISGRAGSTEWFAGVLLGIAIVVGGVAPLAQLVGLVTPWNLDGGMVHATGVALFAAGLAGTLWAQLAMGDSWRIGVDHDTRTALVSQGPFRWVRNPIYTWMTFASAGLVALAPNWLAVASFVALLIALEIQVRVVEEPYLLRTHGESYRRYATDTGRFVPGIGRLATMEERGNE